MSLYGRILERQREGFDDRVWRAHHSGYADEYIAKREGCTVDEVHSSLRRTRLRKLGEAMGNGE